MWTGNVLYTSSLLTFVGIPEPPKDDPNATGLYTAIQEQIGLKMGPAKIPDDVIVIDHVEKPSEN